MKDLREGGAVGRKVEQGIKLLSGRVRCSELDGA